MDQYSIMERHQPRTDVVTDRVYKAAGLIVAVVLVFGFTLLNADSQTKIDIWWSGISLFIAGGLLIAMTFRAGHRLCAQIQQEFEDDCREQLGKEPTARLIGLLPFRSDPRKQGQTEPPEIPRIDQ